MHEEPVILTRGLTRYFGVKPAVYELNLDVPRGCVFAFLGRNGSGKTTTIRMLAGLEQPTRGTGSILGCDIQALTPEIRARICEGMEWAGLTLDAEKNAQIRGRAAQISTSDSKVQAWVIPTDEELLIARDTVRCILGEPHPT